ncbi:MAG: glycosyltransferase [Gammaproteobacteria bacterium]|nr:glycosyltransferase [Gammaproteobacteria bacterium]
MKKIINLIDDARPGGIRSLLDDMAAAGLWAGDSWKVQAVDSCKPIRLDADYDVIVVHYSMAWRKLPALFLLRRAYPKARLVIVEHHYTKRFEQLHVASPRRFRTLLRLCYGLADQVIAVSMSQARWLRSAGIIDATKLETIPACRNYARFLSLPRVERAGGPIVIGALGRIEHAKGFDLLIRAFADLPTGQFRLRIAGDGSQREALQQLAANLEHVEFVGHLDDAAPFLASCDVLAMPSRHEAFGLVCAEAKAAGLPVVVSDVDALPEQAQGCGVIVAAEDVGALREALMHMTRASRLLGYSRNARKSVVNAWSDFLSSWSRVLA